MNKQTSSPELSSKNKSINIAGRRSYRNRSVSSNDDEEEEDPRSKSSSDLNATNVDDEIARSSSDESLSKLKLTDDSYSFLQGPSAYECAPTSEKHIEKSFSYLYMILGVSLVALFSLYLTDGDLAAKHCDLTPLDSFSLDIQDAVKTAVQEIQRFDKPSVLTFIYNKNHSTEHVVNENIHKIANYTTCMLNGGNKYVEVTRDDVTNPAIIADRGLLITKYRRKLEEYNVMVVKHLEMVPGDVAMAFHFLCDQYTPVVRRALIIFTLECDFGGNTVSESRLVEDILTDKWKGLKADNIPPLIARLTNAITKM